MQVLPDGQVGISGIYSRRCVTFQLYKPHTIVIFFSTLALIGTTANVWVQFDENVFRKKADDAGDVCYTLVGTSATFQLQARAPKGKFTLQAFLDGLSTVNHAQGSTINLGWEEDSVTPFILSGTTLGKLSSSDPPTDWMQRNLSTLGHRQLRHLCIPGSHDSGMSLITGHTGFADPAIVLTQSNDIGAQLSLGARYFDIRPTLAAGAFKTGHYSKIPVDLIGWQGANGQAVQDIIRQINDFTADNAELIILNLSHDLNTDVGRQYRPMNQGEWDGTADGYQGLVCCQHRRSNHRRSIYARSRPVYWQRPRSRYRHRGAPCDSTWGLRTEGILQIRPVQRLQLVFERE
jgi:hypothetical protein